MREATSVENSRPSYKTQAVSARMFSRFSGEDIADEYLLGVIEVARWATSRWDLQTCRWIIVRSESAKHYLEAAVHLPVPLGSAPVIMICLADTLAWKSAAQRLQEMIADRRVTEEESREALKRLGEYYTSSPEGARRGALASAFAAVQQILEGAAQCSLSAYWVTEFNEAKLKAHFHIPEHFLVAALIPIGYREETPNAPVAELPPIRIYKEKFGEPFHQTS
jgi:nitroreductase